MRIQEVIHKIELGEGVWALRAVVAALLVVVLWAWYDVNEFQNFKAPEAMEAAQLARNLADDKGFTTQCVRPFTLNLVQKKQGIDARLSRHPHPDLSNPPVYPLLLAILMKGVSASSPVWTSPTWAPLRLTGLMEVLPFRFDIAPRFWMYQPEVLIALFNQALFFLTLWLTYRLARRLFDRPIALVTVIVLLGSDTLWKFSTSGLSTNLLMLIFMALLSVLAATERGARDDSQPVGWTVRQAVLLGALAGVAALTRYSFAWLLLPLLFCGWNWFPKRRLLVCSLMATAFLVILGPWLNRNHLLSGTLFGVPGFAIYQETIPFPETRLERSLDPDLDKVEVRDCFRKVFAHTGDIIQNELPRLGGAGWVGAFFLVAVFLPYKDPARSRLRLFLLLSLVLLLFVQAGINTHLSRDAPVFNTENLLIVLLPGVALFGTALFFALLDQFDLAIEEMRYVFILLFLMATSSQLITTLLPPRTYPLNYPPYLPPWIQETARLLEKGELMMSDMPWAVAWYGNRSCVWTTLDYRRAFFAVNDEQKAVSALYLTPLTTDAKFLSQVLQSQDHDWSRFAVELLVQTNVPALFPLKKARSKYFPDQLFLCDRERWLETK